MIPHAAGFVPAGIMDAVDAPSMSRGRGPGGLRPRRQLQQRARLRVVSASAPPQEGDPSVMGLWRDTEDPWVEGFSWQATVARAVVLVVGTTLECRREAASHLALIRNRRNRPAAID